MAKTSAPCHWPIVVSVCSACCLRPSTSGQNPVVVEGGSLQQHAKQQASHLRLLAGSFIHHSYRVSRGRPCNSPVSRLANVESKD